MPAEQATIDRLSEILFEVKQEIGEFRGELKGFGRELTRISTALEQHSKEDRDAHAAQDERLLNTTRQTAERLAVLELAKARGDSEREENRRAADHQHDWRNLRHASLIGGTAAVLASIVLAIAEHFLR